MHVDQIIFPKFQGKYEKIKIIYIYIYIYIFKTVVTKKFVKSKILKSHTFLYMSPLKNICENYNIIVILIKKYFKNNIKITTPLK